MYEIKNLTPHAIHIGAIIIPSEGYARVSEEVTHAAPIWVSGCELQTVTISYGPVDGLPPFQEGMYLIVSDMTARAIRALGDQRADLLVPAQPIRDASGKVIGCESLRRA